MSKANAEGGLAPLAEEKSTKDLGLKAIFLDRDGVINRYPGDTKYVTKWQEFRFLAQAKKAIAQLYQNRFKIFVVSNQAGVGKGIFSQKSLDIITKNMLEGIERAGGKIEAVYYCTHKPEQNCSCRKPKSGLINIIKRKYSLDLKRSFFIGDTIRDVHTARLVGCKSILVLSGKEKLSHRQNWQAQPDFIFKNLYAATRFILNPVRNTKSLGKKSKISNGVNQK